MTTGESGWTYVEYLVSLMVFSLLVPLVYPVLTVIYDIDSAKKTHLNALWIGQEMVERQIAITGREREGQGRQVMHVDGVDYVVKWTRERMRDNLDLVDVSVSWQMTESKKREIHLERYVCLQ